MSNGRTIFSTFDLKPITGPTDVTTDIFAGSSILSNSDNLSFFGTSSYYPRLSSDWGDIERRVSENSAAQVGQQQQSLQTAQETRFGLGAAPSGGQLDEILEESVEGVEGAEVVEAPETPWGMLALVNEQAGQVINSSLTAKGESNINAQYAQNMAQHGLNVPLNSELVRQQNESVLQRANAGGSVGALFGPIGALIGHAVAGAVSADPSILNTANSFMGSYNPSNLNAVASATTADLSQNSNIDDSTANI